VDAQPGLRYTYVEGDWDALPDFSLLPARSEGILAGITLDIKREKEYYGVAFRGYLKVPADGVYSFFLSSDDGSRMVLDDTVLIDNDGLHSMEQRRGIVALQKGLHQIRIEYFNKTGGEGVSLSWRGPGFPLGVVPPEAFFHR
jgi:alpha-L-fucosidase